MRIRQSPSGKFVEVVASRQALHGYIAPPPGGGAAPLVSFNLLTSGAFTVDLPSTDVVFNNTSKCFEVVTAGRYTFGFQGTLENTQPLPVGGMLYAWVPLSIIGSNFSPLFGSRAISVFNGSAGTPFMVAVSTPLDLPAGSQVTFAAQSTAGGGTAFTGPAVQLSVTPV